MFFKKEAKIIRFNSLTASLILGFEAELKLEKLQLQCEQIIVVDVHSTAIQHNSGKISAAIFNKTLLVAFGPNCYHWEILAAATLEAAGEIPSFRFDMRQVEPKKLLDVFKESMRLKSGANLLTKQAEWLGGAEFWFLRNEPRVDGFSADFGPLIHEVKDLALEFLHNITQARN